MRKRWSPWRAAIWGVGVGVLAAVGASRGNASMSDAELAGQIIGSIVFPPIVFALGAAIRNWAVGNPATSNVSTLAHDPGQRGGIPDWLVIPLGVLLAELHRVFLAPLLAAMAMIALVGRDHVKANISTFLVFDLLFQWMGMAIIFLAAAAMSRSRSPRTAHWLGALSVGIGVLLATGQYAAGYPIWYEIAFLLGSVFAWAIALWYVAGKSQANSV